MRRAVMSVYGPDVDSGKRDQIFLIAPSSRPRPIGCGPLRSDLPGRRMCFAFLIDSSRG